MREVYLSKRDKIYIMSVWFVIGTKCIGVYFAKKLLECFVWMEGNSVWIERMKGKWNEFEREEIKDAL